MVCYIQCDDRFINKNNLDKTQEIHILILFSTVFWLKKIFACQKQFYEYPLEPYYRLNASQSLGRQKASKPFWSHSKLAKLKWPRPPRGKDAAITIVELNWTGSRIKKFIRLEQICINCLAGKRYLQNIWFVEDS